MDLIERVRSEVDKSSQAVVAEKLGVGQSLISRWLSGERKIPLKHAEGISALANVPVDIVVREIAELHMGQ